MKPYELTAWGDHEIYQSASTNLKALKTRAVQKLREFPAEYGKPRLYRKWKIERACTSPDEDSELLEESAPGVAAELQSDRAIIAAERLRKVREAPPETTSHSRVTNVARGCKGFMHPDFHP